LLTKRPSVYPRIQLVKPSQPATLAFPKIPTKK
ncbi:hypothetical protein TIFTF001_011087, partial [Ficus carica]